jgi:hypothetical protein
MVTVIGKKENKADISLQGEYNRIREMDGSLSISTSVIENGKTSKYAKIAVIKKIANSSNICNKGNKYVYKYARLYGKPVRRVNMWYVNKCSTVCTQRSSLQLERVQAQVSHVTLSSKSSKMAEKCVKKNVTEAKK